ncbi:GcrA family cell cycle regulator [Aestuariispira ectoiniformans]|uniref:GcrA family cell cycle regulator n=1 Tax=Aestuariispira ectoiniformans TaxID=2775080 RepID=UPI00223A71B3|nr:GcrA family cell cycle regulator [Aestuariispira ectoiniformans]
MEWTEERVETLKGLWTKGYSARQIAERLGGVTRNAVIGKAHRMGLSSRPSPIKREKPAAPAVKERSCQWPVGHPGSDEFHFCGQSAEAGRPYCPKHCAVAYRRPSSNENAA